MNDNQLLRYSRHILLDEIDIGGQQALLDAHALVLGAGGLGSAAALYLAAAGVGRMTLIDDDRVDLTNLQRQIMHSTARVGMLKVESGRTALAQINDEIEIDVVAERVAGDRLSALVAGATVVLDCSDNFATRHAINRACVAHKVPLVSGAAIRFDGQVSVFDPRDAASPCYACLFAPDLEFEETLCSEMGVFAPLVGIIGSTQAAEALKLAAGIGVSLAGRLLMLDARSMTWDSVKVPRNPVCPVCGKDAESCRGR
ncbi:molybdopterin-synthase adenylyltransferase MoeB [Oxalobacteraceae bacterium CAVE-383]|nr:molybdopterin-synthase adenylyltransferase MoeB [Oxalobacteraceae bacterium CAVE-383]